MSGKRLILVILSFFVVISLFSQDIAVSSYFNAADPRDEWTELFVFTDNVDLRNWKIQDNNASQNQFQEAIVFKDLPFWNHVRAGTIIMIHHRSMNSSGGSYPVHTEKNQGYLELSANDANFFSGGDFGTSPVFGGPSLNIDDQGDLVRISNASGAVVQALGHKTDPGPNWNSTPAPKLNHTASLPVGSALCVSPGETKDGYGMNLPQNGTTFTTISTGTELSR